MLKTSTVSRHPAAGAIDRALAAGNSIAAIARDHALTESAIRRRRNTLRQSHPEYLAALAAISR